MLRFLRGADTQDFVVIDSQFPQKDPFAFRNTEINEYMRRIVNFSSYTMYPMAPGNDAWFAHSYGMEQEAFAENKRGYEKHFPQNGTRISYLQKNRRYHFKLAYSYFLGETYVLLPFYEMHKVPFIFTLYPGGGFGLDFDKSDAMLEKIFSSPYFRGVIVTQQLTRDYLLKKKLCPPERISYIYGGFVQFRPEDLKSKQFYGRDKTTFDICFVGAKYTERGIDKGYDLFIAAAKIIAQAAPNARFHVVGGFDKNDIDSTEFEDKITFYGFRGPDFLSNFYACMDIYLSPNRPRELYPGNFDGFPLGIDAGYCGVAMWITDELKMNHHFDEQKEIVVIPLDEVKIARMVLSAYQNPQELYELSAQGQSRAAELFDINFQITERIKIYGRNIKLKMSEV